MAQYGTRFRPSRRGWLLLAALASSALACTGVAPPPSTAPEVATTPEETAVSGGTSPEENTATEDVGVLDEDTLLAEDTPVSADPLKRFENRVLLFGNLHAHSNLSDDIRPFRAELRPANAFAHARDNGVDFLALSDHHKGPKENSSSRRLFLTSTEFREELLEVAENFNAANPGFVAIPALEWGNTSTGNHINIIAPDQLPPDSIMDPDYDDLLEWAGEHAQFVNFNHPKSWSSKSNRNRDVGNFGQALFDSTEDYVAEVDSVVNTVSIITTVVGGHLTGADRHSQDKVHRDMQWENFYKRFLNMGLHLSPSANQDTHFNNWGTVTAARTAIWADDATFDGLMDGFRANRGYATEDDELAVIYKIRYKDEDFWMGQTVLIDEDETEVELLAQVWQTTGSDGDATDEGPYTIDIVSDWDGIGGRQASIWETVEDHPGGVLLEMPLLVVDGEYIYLAITEEEGSDNPLGQGEDVFINGTDTREPDGMRDDMNDQAWTAPIWFEFVPALDDSEAFELAEDAGPAFIWDRRSNLYHDDFCWAVERIGLAARLSGPAPAGRTKHACPARSENTEP